MRVIIAIAGKMSVLFDTNVLLLLAQSSHPDYGLVDRALQTFIARNEMPYIAIQNIAEFWNVATRPIANNGFGFKIQKAKEEITKLEKQFEIVSETIASYRIWKTLVSDFAVSGVQLHDARLVSIMLAHDVSQILTFNTKDFARFDGIEAVHPGDLN